MEAKGKPCPQLPVWNEADQKWMASLTDKQKSAREPRVAFSPEVLMSASIEKALRFTESFLLWIRLQPRSPRVPMNGWWSLTLALAGLYMVGQAESFLKLKLATFDGQSKRQTELPTVPAEYCERTLRCKTLLPGPAGARLCSWIGRTLARGQAFTFFMKRAAAEMSEAQIKQAEEKSFKILTTPHKEETAHFAFANGEVLLVTPEVLDAQVIRTVREIVATLKGVRFSTIMPCQIPSAHAHDSTSRAEGGAKGRVAARQPALVSFLAVLKDLPASRACAPTPYLPVIPDGCDGGCMGDCVSCWRGHDGRSTDLDVRYASIVQEAAAENSEYRPVLQSLGIRPPNEEMGSASRPVQHWFDESVCRWAARDLTVHAPPETNFRAKIIGLPEPLKIRTITAGPESAYYTASYLQKFVHGALRHHDVFRLIGQPLALSDIHRTFFQPLQAGEFFVSGDYKSATDLISARLSNVCARELCSGWGIPKHLEELFVTALTGHTVRQAKKVGLQANGQLMGSPVSFPVLCIINAALTRYALEIRYDTVGKTPLGKYPLLINGDDVAFATDKDGYELWKIITRLGGLQFSLGKNFTSPDFLVLNSCMFELIGRRCPRPMAESNASRREPLPRRGYRFHPEDAKVVRVTTQAERTLQYRTIEEHGYAHLHDLPEWLDQSWLASARNVFYVSPYLNPDYLGPVGRVFPHEDTPLHQMPAFRRYDLKDIEGLFRPEGYAILPGLQQAWLGRSTGTYRHRLNLEFIRSWKPVLALSSGKKGNTPYTTDWWLPTGLGGLGLENTSPTSQLEDSSLASRKLAHWLYHHPEHVPVAMPALTFRGELAERIQKTVSSFKPVFFPAGVALPPGYVSHAELTTTIERIGWMGTFQAEQEGPVWRRGCDKEARKFVLAEALTRFRASRARMWATGHGNARSDWWKGPSINREMLAAFQPPQRAYCLELPSRPKTELRQAGEPPMTAPWLPVGKMVSGSGVLEQALITLSPEECARNDWLEFPSGPPVQSRETAFGDYKLEVLALYEEAKKFPVHLPGAAGAPDVWKYPRNLAWECSVASAEALASEPCII
jgi:hypothetical protein